MHLNIQSHLEFEKYCVDFNLQGGFTPKRPCKPCCIVCDFPKCTCTLKATRKWLSYQQSLNPKNPLKVITNPNGADLCAWLIRHGLSISDKKRVIDCQPPLSIIKKSQLTPLLLVTPLFNLQVVSTIWALSLKPKWPCLSILPRSAVKRCIGYIGFSK